MTEYVVGFLFDSSMDKVILIKKNRPDWQKGLLNGVGGYVEDDERYHPKQTMVREFEEETGVVTEESFWKSVCILTFPDAEITFYYAADNETFLKCKTTTDEEIKQFWVDSAIEGSYATIDNIPMLLELCIQRSYISG
jgi:8-oxo-dGTP diphosphatase